MYHNHTIAFTHCLGCHLFLVCAQQSGYTVSLPDAAAADRGKDDNDDVDSERDTAERPTERMSVTDRLVPASVLGFGFRATGGRSFLLNCCGLPASELVGPEQKINNLYVFEHTLLTYVFLANSPPNCVCS